MTQKLIEKLIEKLISEFIGEADSRFDWLLPLIRSSSFLPLYNGWLATIGLRPDGSFLWIDTDLGDTVGQPRPLEVPFLQRLAVCAAAREYPELRALIPPRPVDAIDCPTCDGAGRLGATPTHLICECGGVGWIIPGEERGPTPG